jgi:hypothetical protein
MVVYFRACLLEKERLFGGKQHISVAIRVNTQISTSFRFVAIKGEDDRCPLGTLVRAPVTIGPFFNLSW